ncbi:hypothetical protein AB0F13_05655 [Streptomyces sp. NPDC026206]|uniref:hypothetical protein n=1 Tax=Streptomyces sp. NPDC026206 TaxID=3157089 RepID=UPI0033F167BC
MGPRTGSRAPLHARGTFPHALAWAATYEPTATRLFARPWEGVAAAVALTLAVGAVPALRRWLRRAPVAALTCSAVPQVPPPVRATSVDLTVPQSSGGLMAVVPTRTGGQLFAAGLSLQGQVPGILRDARGRRVTAVAAGGYHSLAVCEEGRLLAAGLDDEEQVSGILAAARGEAVAAVAAGGFHSLAVTRDGRLLAAGKDHNQQVSGIRAAAGDGKVTAMAAGSVHSLAVADDGGLLAAGHDGDRQVSGIVAAARGEQVASVAAGDFHSLAVTRDGRLLAAGRDEDRQVSGILAAAEGTKVVAVSAAALQSLALTDDGRLLAAGRDGNHQVSGIVRAAQGRRIAAIAAGDLHSLAVTWDGALLGAGKDGDAQVSGILAEVKGRQVTLVAAGGFHSLAVAAPDGPKGRAVRVDFAARGPAGSLTLQFLRQQDGLDVRPESGGPAQDFAIREGVPVQLVVRRSGAGGGEALGNGSVYFTFDEPTGVVGVDTRASRFPSYLTCTGHGANRFTFTWSA